MVGIELLPAVFAQLLHQPALVSQRLADLPAEDTRRMQKAGGVFECGCQAFVLGCVAGLPLDSEGFRIVEHCAVEESGVGDLLTTQLDAGLDDLADEFPFPFIAGPKRAKARFLNFGEKFAILVVQERLLGRRGIGIDKTVCG